MAPIEVQNLTKRYGEVLANDDLSFAVRDGEIFGYLGPNGAGKTTTIRTLMGFQSPTEGTATVLGADVHDEDALVDAKRRIGYLPSNPSFDEDATGSEILDLHASVKGESRRAELLEIFDPPVDRTVRTYSTGNVQKLALVQTFMHDPDLVVADEPTSGLDPLMQREFNEFVREERRRGTTVFFSSHVLSEVRQVCDRVAILRDGRLVTVESVEELLDRSGKFVRLRAAGSVPESSLAFDGVHDLRVSTAASEGIVETATAAATDGASPGEAHDGSEAHDGTAVSEATFTYTGDVNDLVERLASLPLLDLDVEEAPLEEVFMRFYGDDDGNAANGGEANA
jgi:ABC-2 type transport system ATP-binding protein